MGRTSLTLLTGLLGVTFSIRADDAKPLPHPHDPVLQAEHLKMLDLISDADITHTAVRDGAWSDKATWKDGKTPGEGANVLIPKGKSVTLDSVASAIRGLRVDGELNFTPDRDTGLAVDTIVVSPDGKLIVGTAEKPIAANRRATITFTDRGPLDTRHDPAPLGRGLIAQIGRAHV